MTAYYNEHDPFAAAWLRELIKAGHIADGDVDERSIEDVRPVDLVGYTQCHFFAGIGVWSYALRLAGWPDDRPVWTGSCPCQPFSQAGKGQGTADERHLWPALHWLIQQCQPDLFFGEQVASKDGLAWLDIVQADLEATGYAGGAIDLCAAGLGAPHIRQRLWIVAERLADSNPRECNRRAKATSRDKRNRQNSGRSQGDSSTAGGCVNDMSTERDTTELQLRKNFNNKIFEPNLPILQTNTGRAGNVLNPGPVNGFWRAADWLSCRDGKWRAVEPGTFPLVNGAAQRVGRLRGYGNAIVAPVAAEVIRAYLSTNQKEIT